MHLVTLWLQASLEVLDMSTIQRESPRGLFLFIQLLRVVRVMVLSKALRCTQIALVRYLNQLLLQSLVLAILVGWLSVMGLLLHTGAVLGASLLSTVEGPLWKDRALAGVAVLNRRVLWVITGQLREVLHVLRELDQCHLFLSLLSLLDGDLAGLGMLARCVDFRALVGWAAFLGQLLLLFWVAVVVD